MGIFRLRKNQKPLFTAFIAIFVGAIGMVGSDMFAPSLPAIRTFFATSRDMTQMTITIYFLGLGLSQLIYGPLSDAIGRRKSGLIGLFSAFFGSLFCCIAPTIKILIFGRLIQGIGAGSAYMLLRTVQTDVLRGKLFAKVASLGGLIFALSPAFAPTLGGYVEELWGWRVTFIFIMLLNAFSCILVFFLLPETNKNLDPKSLLPKMMVKNYLKILRNRDFLRYLVCSASTMAGISVYITVSPFLFQSELHLTPIQYGTLAFYLAISSILGRLLNAWLLNKFSIEELINGGFLTTISGSLLMLILGLLGYFSVAVIIIPMMIFMSASGLLFGNAVAGGMQTGRKTAGSTAALYGSLQILAAFLGSSIAILAHTHSQLPVATIFLILSLLGFFGFNIHRLIGWRKVERKI